MTPQERKSLSEQLLANPLFLGMLSEMEARAIESLIHADTEQTRIEAQWRVSAARSFRRDCEAHARNTPTRKGDYA